MKTWYTPGGYKITRVVSGRSNVFLLTNGQSNILVDTSPAFMWNALQKRLAMLGMVKIDLLVLTHSHFDHAANAARIKAKYHAKVMIHHSEVEYLTSGDNILPIGTNRFTKWLVRSFAEKFRSFALYQPCQPDLTADEYLDLSDYGFNAYIMHTPGHTLGSMSIIIENEIALVGDTIMGTYPWTAFPPFASDTVELIVTWEKLLKTGCRLFLPSHGPAITRERLHSDFSKRTQKNTY